MKIVLSAIALNMGILYASSSSFAFTFGKNQNEYSYGVMETPDGYVLVGEALLGGGGKTDATAIKLDPMGSFMWYKTYGKNDRDVLRFPFISDDGNYIHFGYTDFGGIITIRRPTSIKTDPNGNLIWTKAYNISGEFLGVIKHSGEFVAVGRDYLGNGLLAFLTSDANIRGVKTYPSGSLYGAAPDGSGGFILVGQKNNNGWIMRVDSSGNVLWSREYGGSNIDLFKEVIVIPPYAFVGGSTQSVGAGNWDVWILKVDITDGDVIFSKTYGGTNEDEIRSLMPNGSKIGVLAYTRTWGFGGAEFWFFEIDLNGNLLASYTYGGNGDDFPQMGKTTSDGGYVLVGYSQTAAFTSGRAYDHFIVKISASGFSCINSGSPIPVITDFIPIISNLAESPTTSTPGFNWINFTSTSPDLDITQVCSPLGGDEELSVSERYKGIYSINLYGNTLRIDAYGKEIGVFTVDGRVVIKAQNGLEAKLPRGIYKVKVGKDIHTIVVR